MATPAGGAAKPPLANMPPELVARIAELIPDATGRLAQSSHDIRQQLGRLQPRPPYHFHAFLDTYPAANNKERRDLMLSALEAQAERFRLLSIEIPDFVLDEMADVRIHPPRFAPERGAVRLGAVLGGRGAALESLDLSNTHITTWREVDLALPSCRALKRVDLSRNFFCNDFARRNHPFVGLAHCRGLQELVLEG